MKKSSLEEVLEQLYAVREEVRGAIEASVKTQLSVALQVDAIIQKLEDARDQKSCKLNGQEILAMFGKVLELLPSIAKLLEQLRGAR